MNLNVISRVLMKTRRCSCLLSSCLDLELCCFRKLERTSTAAHTSENLRSKQELGPARRSSFSLGCRHIFHFPSSTKLLNHLCIQDHIQVGKTASFNGVLTISSPVHCQTTSQTVQSYPLPIHGKTQAVCV